MSNEHTQLLVSLRMVLCIYSSSFCCRNLQTKINTCMLATEMYLSDRFKRDAYEYNWHGNVTLLSPEIRTYKIGLCDKTFM